MPVEREERLGFEVRPSFEPWVTLQLIFRDKTYALACSVMGFTQDTGTWEVDVVVDAAEHLLTDFWSISLNPKANRAVGVDGITYSLHLTSGTSTRQVSWWSRYPDGWEVLDPLLRRLLTLAGPRVRRHVNLRECLKR